MKVADFLGVEHTEIEGSLRYIQKLIAGEWDDEFLIIPPGETVSLEQFINFSHTARIACQ